MITTRVKITWRGKEVDAKVTQAAEASMRDTVAAIAGTAVRLSPAITGNNRRSIIFSANGLKGKVASTSGYGGFLETGTGIYGPLARPITPKTKPFLAWQNASGNWIFAREVRGRPATPYLRPAVMEHFTAEKFAALIRGHLR